MNCTEPSFWRAIGEWIYHFQTLIAGIAAIGAAAATILQIRRQVKQADVHRGDDIKRTHVAHKIEGIWAVTLVAEYTDICLEFITKTDKQKDTLKYVKKASDVPNFPINTLETVSKLAYGLDTDSAEKVRAFVGHAQIQHARLKSLVSDMSGNQKTANGSPIASNPFALIEAKLDFFILKFQCNRVLGYCRGDYLCIPDLPDAIEFLREASFGYFNLGKDEKAYLKNSWPKKGWVDVSKV